MSPVRWKEAYISVDVEASGPVPGSYSMLSVGACLIEDLGQEFYVELKPISVHFIPEALHLTGFSLEDLTTRGADPAEAMARLSSWLDSVAGGKQPLFVGFNAGFDWSFINYYMHVYHGSNPFGFAPLDIKSYYAGVSGCSWEETKSSRLPSSLKPEGSTREKVHNALSDARYQAEIFQRILRKHNRLPK